MSDPLPDDHICPSLPTSASPYEAPSIPPTSRPAFAATKTLDDAQSISATDIVSPEQCRVASLIAHKPTVLQYGIESNHDIKLLSGTLYLVTKVEYESNVKGRFLTSSVDILDSDGSVTYSASRTPWVLLHPKYERSWIHEGWLIYDFANAGLTIGQDFVAITFDRASFNATERFSPIGQYALDGTFAPHRDHFFHTILALPIFSEPLAIDSDMAALDNTVALGHYNTLGGGRQRRVQQFSLPLVPEYPPRPVSSQTMRCIELIGKNMGYLAGSSNAYIPKRTWLRQEPLLQHIVNPVTGTLNPASQLFGLRGNHAVFRARAWKQLCFATEKERRSSALPSYWQNVFEEKCFVTSASGTKEQAAAEDGQRIVKRDSVAAAPPVDDQEFGKQESCAMVTADGEFNNFKSEPPGTRSSHTHRACLCLWTTVDRVRIVIEEREKLQTCNDCGNNLIFACIRCPACYGFDRRVHTEMTVEMIEHFHAGDFDDCIAGPTGRFTEAHCACSFLAYPDVIMIVILIDIRRNHLPQ
nr:hypothetical protein CFP56_22338 [Quercus suber]